MTNNKYIGAVVAASAVLITLMIAGFTSTPTLSQEHPLKIIERGSSLGGSESFLQDGGRSAALVDVQPEEIQLARGTTTTVNVTLSHVAGANPLPVITLLPSSFQGSVLLPSIQKITTPEERAELASQGKSIPGSIDVAPLLRFESSSIALKAGETKSISMIIALPKTLPDEIVGKSIHFSPQFEIEEMQNIAPENQSDAAVFAPMVTVLVAS